MASNAQQPSAPAAPPPAQPAAPAPQKKSTSPLVWILGGCGGALVLAAIAFAVVTYWGVHKLKGFAESAKKNPAVFAAKLAVAANPDLEVVSSDDEDGTVTIRNKKTGEQITMNAADIKNGRLKFKNEKGEEVTFEGSGEKGKEGLRIKSAKGSMAFGDVEAVKMPAWVPAYPGAKVMASTRQKTEDGFTGTYSFQTPDAVATVLGRFESELDSAGFAVEETGAGAVGSLRAKADGGARTVAVTAIPIGVTTQVTVEYGATGGAKE